MSDSEQRDNEIQKLIEQNPKVDRDQFEEVQRAVKSLRDEGVPKPTYGIVSPYERRSVGNARRSWS